VQLPHFHRIAHKYLVTSAVAEIAEDATPSDRWLPLLIELDQARITPEETLQGITRETLTASRRKGLKVTTWQECYASTGRVSLEDGKVRTLRREVTHAIHNAAKRPPISWVRSRLTRHSRQSGTRMRTPTPTSASRCTSTRSREGINDGFLTPFRVKQIATTLDEYVYTPADEIVITRRARRRPGRQSRTTLEAYTRASLSKGVPSAMFQISRLM